MSSAVAVETTMTATVFRVRIVDRYAFGSACRRVTVRARLLPSSARLRMRMRLTLVSDVSAAAANAAMTSPRMMTMMSGVIGSGTVVGLSRSPEQFAHAPSLMDAHDRLGDQRRDREDAELGRIVETVTAVVIRDGVGDADLVDGCGVESRHRAVAEHAVGGHDVNGLCTPGEQCHRRVDEGAPGGDEVVDDHADRAFDVTDDIDDLDRVVPWTPFVDEGDRCVEDASKVARAVHTAGVRRHHHDVVAVAFAHAPGEDLGGDERVNRDVEEPLDRLGVEVDADHPVGSGELDDVR